MKLNFSLLLVVFIFFSCRGQNGANSVVYTIPIDNTNKGIALTDISTDISFVPLETSDSVLVGNFLRYQMSDSLLFIADVHQNSVFMFDDNGGFVNKVGSKGRGVSEILEISDFFVDKRNKEIIVWDNGNKKRITYTYEGKTIDSRRAMSASDFTKVGEELYLLTNQNTRKHIISVMDNNRITKGYLQCDKKYNKLALFRSSHFFFHYNNGVSFVTRFSPVVYSFEDGGVKEKYILDFGKYTFRGDGFSNDNIQEELDKSNFTSYYNSFSESKSHIYFSFKQYNKYHSCLIDKDSGKAISTFGWTFLSTHLSKNRTKYHFNMLPVFKNDTLFGLSYMSDIFCVLETMTLDERMKLFELIPSLKTVYECSSPTDNPVLISIKINKDWSL